MLCEKLNSQFCCTCIDSLTDISYISTMGNSESYTNGTNTTTDNINYYLERTPCDPTVSIYIAPPTFLQKNNDKLLK